MKPDLETYRYSVQQITALICKTLDLDPSKTTVRFNIDQCGDDRSPTTQVTGIVVEVNNRFSNQTDQSGKK